MNFLKLEDLGRGGEKVSLTILNDFEIDQFISENSAYRFRYSYIHPDGNRHLDALLLSKKSDVLIVSFHGALMRSKYKLPRFERLATFGATPYNSLYISDPGLWANERVGLTWFTGWDTINLKVDIIRLVRSAMKSTGSTKVVFTGGSGGGFASLQCAPDISGSVALVFDPQTTIYAYQGKTPNTRWAFHKSYIRALLPELGRDEFTHIDFQQDWTGPYGAKMSALKTYSIPVQNKVLYVTNKNDSHHSRHYLPFIKVAERAGNILNIESVIHDGPQGHVSPNQALLQSSLNRAIEMAA